MRLGLMGCPTRPLLRRREIGSRRASPGILFGKLLLVLREEMRRGHGSVIVAARRALMLLRHWKIWGRDSRSVVHTTRGIFPDVFAGKVVVVLILVCREFGFFLFILLGCLFREQRLILLNVFERCLIYLCLRVSLVDRRRPANRAARSFINVGTAWARMDSRLLVVATGVLSDFIRSQNRGVILFIFASKVLVTERPVFAVLGFINVNSFAIRSRLINLFQRLRKPNT
jgi:hypothetical protein